MTNKHKTIRVVELFAGVGGFRLGLEACNIENKQFKIVWSNQFEPSTKTQHASLVYQKHFGKHNHNNQDIRTIKNSNIPEHDLLVAGFPCQDYSVANTLQYAKGLQGTKGNLWWEIHRILKAKRPKMILLENVGRLLQSPSKNKGLDFAQILQSLSKIGYDVEWRVINAAEYGMPQRRIRLFIFGYKRDSNIFQNVFSKTFPALTHSSNTFCLTDFLNDASKTTVKKSPFLSAGTMKHGIIETCKASACYQGHKTVLKDVLEPLSCIPLHFFIKQEDLERWQYVKGAKRIMRQSKNGHCYTFSEGAMSFPDSLEKPSRTIITSEGGRSPSRSRHTIKTSRGIRRLTPVELERLNMFPDNYTYIDGISDSRRSFLMGNAIVTGVIGKIGKYILEQ